MQQYAQSGLKDSIPIYSVFTVDALTLPQIKELALIDNVVSPFVKTILLPL